VFNVTYDLSVLMVSGIVCHVVLTELYSNTASRKCHTMCAGLLASSLRYVSVS